MCFSRRSNAALMMLLVIAFAEPVGAQQQSSKVDHGASPSESPAALNPQLLTNIHVPLLAVIDVLQRRQEIADALAQWEAASQNAVPLTSEDEHIAYMIHKSKRTGHEISIAIDLQNPIQVSDLNQRFAWKTIERTDNRIVLTAEPRETVEQLFYRGFELQLDANTHLPVLIRFIDRSGKQADEPMQLAVKLKPAEQRDVTLTSAEMPAAKNRDREPLRLTELPKKEGKEANAAPSDVPPDVEALLKDWEAASSRHRILDAQFVRRIYDTVFRVEKVSKGRLYYEAPNKGRMDVLAPKLEHSVSDRKDRETGKNYRLEADRPESWIWTGKLVMQINERDKIIESVRTDGLLQGWLVGLSKPLFGLPLVVDIRADDLKRDCEIRIVKRDQLGTWVEAKPRAGTRMAAEINSATVILDRDTYLPKFSKYVDPSGNLETVYAFSNWKVNEQPTGHPLKPDLKGYSGRIPPDDEESAPVEAPKP